MSGSSGTPACRNCGTPTSRGNPEPEHCGHCPPWTCEECGQPCSATNLCGCWTPLAGLNMADLKAIFAAADMSLEVNDGQA